MDWKTLFVHGHITNEYIWVYTGIHGHVWVSLYTTGVYNVHGHIMVIHGSISAYKGLRVCMNICLNTHTHKKIHYNKGYMKYQRNFKMAASS